MSTLNKLLKLAAKLALRSNHKRARVGAVAIRGNAIVGVAWNKDRQSGYDPSQHAEMRLFGKGTGKIDTVFVARIGKKGALLNSRPCSPCFEYILTRGVRAIFYWEDGLIKRWPE